MINLNELTIKKVNEMYKSGKLTPLQLVDLYLEEIAQNNPRLNAVLEVFGDAREQASKITDFTNPLAGIPIIFKDNILIDGKKVSAASKILENYTATYNSTVAQKLIESGVIIPTKPESTVVLKLVGQKQLMVLTGVFNELEGSDEETTSEESEEEYTKAKNLTEKATSQKGLNYESRFWTSSMGRGGHPKCVWHRHYVNQIPAHFGRKHEAQPEQDCQAMPGDDFTVAQGKQQALCGRRLQISGRI